VNTEEVDDYLEYVKKPMDLEMMHMKLDDGEYKCAQVSNVAPVPYIQYFSVFRIRIIFMQLKILMRLCLALAFTQYMLNRRKYILIVQKLKICACLQKI
jgi:Bromodomain